MFFSVLYITVGIISDGRYAYGEEVSLACFAVQGSGVYSFDWLVPDGNTVMPIGQDITSGAISQLIFTAQEEHSGEYTCQVQSGADMASDSTTVTIGNFSEDMTTTLHHLTKCLFVPL